jgi:hypothetical protein
MDVPFPFGLPLPTAVYLVLYLTTLWVHIAFMNYVLAGSAYMAATLLARGRPAQEHPIYALLKDWMPFMLSAAITAGIAPLLFLQVLYKEQFYTANLLLFFRWMAILPALILGFYLAYLLKTRSLGDWPRWSRLAVGCGGFACFAFVGWSWVENHLLSLETQDRWQQHYVSGSHLFQSPELLPRLLLWFVAAFPTMALMVGWQLRDQKREAGGNQPDGARSASAIAIAGVLGSALWAGRYFFLLSEAARKAILGPMGRPYLVLSIAGGAIQLVAWAAVFRQRRLSRGWLILASAGLGANFIGTGIMNETIRLVTLDARVGLPALFSRHAASWKVAGLPVFLCFFGLTTALMILCVRRVRKSAPEGGT